MKKSWNAWNKKWNTENEIIRRRGAYGLQTKNEKEKKFHRAINEKWNKSEEKVTRLFDHGIWKFYLGAGLFKGLIPGWSVFRQNEKFSDPFQFLPKTEFPHPFKNTPSGYPNFIKIRPLIVSY